MSEFLRGKIEAAHHIGSLVAEGYDASVINKVAMQVVIQDGEGGAALVKNANEQGPDYASGMKAAYASFISKLAEAEGEYQVVSAAHASALAVDMLGDELIYDGLRKQADDAKGIGTRIQDGVDSAKAYEAAARAQGHGAHGSAIADAARGVGGKLKELGHAGAQGAIRAVRGGPDAGYLRQAAGVAVPLAGMGLAGKAIYDRYNDDDNKKRASLEGLQSQAQLAALYGY